MITDTDTEEELIDVPKQLVYFRIQQTEFHIIDPTDSGSGGIKLLEDEIANFVDADGGAFTEETIRQFGQDNLGVSL